MKNLPLSERTIFLDKNGVRAARGISAEKVNALVESELVWVFNLGYKHDERHERNLRFWLPEILDARAVENLKLDDVLARILPPGRRMINGSELSQWFLLSPPSVGRIARQAGGVVKNGLLYVERDRLAAWLRQRWIGASQ